MPSATTLKPYKVEDEIHPPATCGAVDYDIPYERFYGSEKALPSTFRNGNLPALANDWLAKFNRLLDKNFQDNEWVDLLILPHASWKEHMALSWEFHQWHYSENIQLELTKRQPAFRISDVQIDKKADIYNHPEGVYLEKLHDLDVNAPIENLTVFVKFKTHFGHGKGIFRLVAVETGLKLLTLYTSLEGIKDHPERLGHKRPEGVSHGQNVGRKIWLEERKKDFKFGENGKQPVVLIVGGGQSGLATAARMKMLGIDSLIIEQNPRIGDNWRNRYSFLVLHDPVWADHLPYIPFPETWPVYTPKDKLGDWFEAYADSLELSYWTNRSVNGAVFDKVTKTWEVQILDKTTNELVTLKPKHLVLATGHSGEPNVPHFPDEEKFKGKLVHSSKHKTGLEFNGERTVVVGSCNSAHDISQDFYEQGADVTMIQRSTTCVINVDKGSVLNCKGLYDQDAPPTETADAIAQSMPVPYLNLVQQQSFRKTVELEKEMISRLTAKGFGLDSGYGYTGLQGKYYRRGGGYYIDVGGSSLIVEDKIHLKSGVEITRFFENGFELSDGTRLEDVKVVVLATGYKNMKTTAERIFGEEMAKDLQEVWGLNDEGELKGVFTDSGHENFWFAGGNLAIVRYFSKKLAMRILAQETGLNLG